MDTAREPQGPPLTLAEAGDVLRYWLAAVRLEETLNVRPRARRIKHASAVPRLDFPAAGQEYFKLPLDRALAGMLVDEQVLQRGFDGELAAFFEAWLLASYRFGQDENDLSHLLCFPVVHLPRGELAGLLRCGVRLRFNSEGQPFRPPSRKERARNEFPAAPTDALIAAVEDEDAGWPFFIDTRLLSHPLGLASEQIDELFEALRARDEWSATEMLCLVVETLERAALDANGAGQLPRTDAASRGQRQNAEELLQRLRRAMQTLLARSGTRAEVYPVGIVIDGTQTKTTFHLQRELTTLIEALDRPNARLPRCVSAYLTREPHLTGEQPQRALFTGPPLTAHQRSAAEHFWGSTLTSVQGPPGTGKTTLILHLCAEAIVRQVDGLLDRSVMGGDLLVIASGNNRAVDNVIEPLTSGDGLPLALRVGSRQVCEFTLAAQLRRTLVWLQKAQVEPIGVHTQELAGALTRFASLRAQLDVLLAPRRNALVRGAEHRRLTNEIAALDAAAPNLEAASSLTPQATRAIIESLPKLQKRLYGLIVMCGAKPGMVQVNKAARHYEKTAARDLPPFERAVADAGIAFDVPLPPLETPLDPKKLMEVWEDGAELFVDRLDEVRERVDKIIEARRLADRRRSLQTELTGLGPPVDGPLPPAGGYDELARAIFAAALEVREAWAKVNAASLQEAVELALQGAEQDRSLRAMFRNDAEQAILLCRLFCVWGSTLLSLGNCLSSDAGSVARVVIDEAGQCHPAYAVSALMRCRSAMIIGDVHQLAPVIELSADDDARLLRVSRLKTSPSRLRPFRVSGDAQVSAQSLAEQAVRARHTLVDHFRCQPEIIAISDALCGYGLRVHTPPPSYTDGPAVLTHPVSMLDLRGEQERVAGSLQNELELRETFALVERLLARGAQPADIAIITPYRGQMERLRRGLFERRIPLEFSPELADAEGAGKASRSGLALGTVHRFQGGERSIVLFSSVVTRASSLPFLNARPNLLNVAASRAQRHLVCLGDRSVLRDGALMRVLVDAARPLDE